MGTDQENTLPAWYAALPATIAAAGVLFFDESGRVMLVHTSYKDDWDIPGGMIEVDRGETALQAARREVGEELGLNAELGPLLSIDQRPAAPDRRPLIAFIFDGGTLGPEELGRIRFLDNEITETRFCTADQVAELAPSPLARRIAASVAAKETAAPVPILLSHGYLPQPFASDLAL
ncbi:hypothetical protein Aph01nite_40930 [Acrocarpospora phusangensis]|uniref:Nudix hydrolase domain-containing protein n=1 Tax=Acrocarpospora phusangensis TaxID=1070424 RepID=A0A919QE49_9ACTN|nr:NUDIX hydrolase [Acrocarpospora phusangensis]GIH25783.1 hypothetical protein Aph01nite_40930 [Acrocarpospora phusangensis]